MARVRITVFRGEGALYEAADQSPNYIMKQLALPEETLLNTNGLQLCIYRDAQKAH